MEFIEDLAVIYKEINEDVAEILLFIFSWFESHPVLPVREFVCATGGKWYALYLPQVWPKNIYKSEMICT